MITVGRLARRFGLSRSALLYYDSIGLLSPSGRSAAGYRLSSEADARRLESICALREAGLVLEDIEEVLEAPRDRTVEVLERHLEGLSERIARPREQQRVVVKLLRSPSARRRSRAMDKRGWVALLRAAGRPGGLVGRLERALGGDSARRGEGGRLRSGCRGPRGCGRCRPWRRWSP